MSHKCDSCDSVTINGVYCHEIGCPRYNAELRAKELEEVEEEEEETFDPILVARHEELIESGAEKSYYSRNDECGNPDLELTLSMVGDWQGCDLVHTANLASFNEEFPGLVNACGEIDNETLLQLTEEKFKILCDWIAGLENYPVIDDSRLSELEHEIHTEKIDDLIRDTEWELESEREITPDSEKLKNLVEELYWEKVSTGDIFIEHDYACVDEKAFVTECASLYQ